MRLRDKKDNLMENDDLGSRLGKKRALQIIIIVLCSFLTLLLIVAGALYFGGGALYENVHVDTMDTSINKNLFSIREILERDGDYTGSDFTPEEIAEAKKGIIYDTFGKFLDEEKNYYAVMQLLDSGIDADASSLLDEFSIEEIDFCRKAYRFGCRDLIEDMSDPPDTDTGTESIEVTTKDPDALKIPTVVETPDKEPDALTGINVKDSDVYNVLLIGLDTRDNDFNGRSDTLIIVSLNKATKRIVLTSFPRDLKVYDPSYGWTKINAIYPRAGNVGTSAGRLATTLSQNFGIVIHDYVVINFAVFKKTIDIFGGVDVPLYYAEYATMNSKKFFNSEEQAEIEASFAGKESDPNFYIHVHLDGEQALYYARIRKVWNPVTEKNERSDDFYRNERQRNVVMDLVRQMRTMSFDELMKIAEEVFPMVATGISYNECL